MEAIYRQQMATLTNKYQFKYDYTVDFSKMWLICVKFNIYYSSEGFISKDIFREGKDAFFWVWVFFGWTVS